MYTYPDATVVCGKPLYEGLNLLNPTIIVEVLSPSTEADDRGSRFEHFKEISSFQEYLLVAQDAPYIEHFVRQSDDTWSSQVIEGMSGHAQLDSIGCELALSEVYAKVDD